MPTYKRSELKESGGFAQVRDALESFEGDVIKVEEGMWSPQTNPDGTMRDAREFIEITSINNRVTKVNTELSMDITTSYKFRVNVAGRNSFWDDFLDACDKLHILLPQGLIGHVVWSKHTHQAMSKGVHTPEFDATNFIPVAFGASPGVVAQPVVQVIEPLAATTDPMELIMNLAIGKTDAQFKSAIGLDPVFVNSAYLPLAKSGAIMQTLLAQGKVKLVDDAAGKQVYSR